MEPIQRIALFGMVAIALFLSACDDDSGSNASVSQVDSSSSIEISSNSSELSSSSKLSSSSVTLSSSSSIPLSSSVEESSFLGGDCTNTYGTNTVTDCRDKQAYKMVVIGTQTWMAENLNYAVDSSWCYNNSPDSCAKYGRLYQWASAMGIDSTYNSITWGGSDVNHQGICPAGWHVPNNDDWQTLYEYVDANNGGEGVGTSLKSTTRWEAYSSVDIGTDLFGFLALPAGYRDEGKFDNIGNNAYFWSAAEYNSNTAHYWLMNYFNESFFDYTNYNKHNGRGVRCLKDAE